jgi:hypothetical protein
MTSLDSWRPHIAINNKLASLEASVASVDKSLAALLKHFDDFHTKDKEKYKEENKEEEQVDDNYYDDYTAYTEHDDHDTRDRRRQSRNRRGMGDHR